MSESIPSTLISALPAATKVSDTDIVVLENGSTTQKITIAQLKEALGINALNTNFKVRRAIFSINCNGNDYTAINIPEGTAFLTAFAFREASNSYHYITGAAQILSSTQVFLYYDAANTGAHTVAVYYIEF